MSRACTSVLVGVVSPVSEIWLKKFMQVGIDVKCMHASFGGCRLSSFGEMATFQKRPNFPFGVWTIVHGHRKI